MLKGRVENDFRDRGFVYIFFEYRRGDEGSYYDAPEPDEVLIDSVYDEDENDILLELTPDEIQEIKEICREVFR